jgi:HEAT repeat protein
MEDKKRLEEWLSQLESADRFTRLTAAHRLATKGEAHGLPVLVDALRDGHAVARTQVVGSLSTIDDERAAGTLFSLMTEDPDEKIRRSAGSALANKVPERAIPVLIRGLDHEDSFVRLAVTKRLEAFKHKLADRRELVHKLVELLGDAEPLVRSRAAAILAEMKDRSSLPALLGVLTDADASVRSAAVRAIGAMGDRSAVPSVIERLGDDHDNVQSAAVRALGDLGDISAIPALKRRAAEDSQSSIANACQQVVQELGGHKPCQIQMETLFPDSVLSVRSATTLKGRVVNSGEGPAFDVSISFSAAGLATAPQNRTARVLGPGRAIHWQLPVTPDQEGTASLDWEIEYEDNRPGRQRLSGVEYLEVSAEDVPSGAPAMTIYEGPVDQSRTVVHGDAFAPGAVKQGEGVVFQKGAQAATPAFCPHCGESLRDGLPIH